MKVIRAVNLTFTAGTNKATAYITVPFQAQHLHVVSAALQVGTAPAAGAAKYCYITSDLTQQSPLGILYQDSTYPIQSAGNLIYDFQNPTVIGQTYTFYMFDLAGAPLNATTGNDTICLLMIFVDTKDSGL